MTRVTLGVCRDCAGLAQVPYDGKWDDGETVMVACQRCGGTGDVDSVRLVAAYECGRRDATEAALARLAELAQMVPLAVGDIERPMAITGEQLRARIGG